jgi:hypothetical protein
LLGRRRRLVVSCEMMMVMRMRLCTVPVPACSISGRELKYACLGLPSDRLGTKSTRTWTSIIEPVKRLNLNLIVMSSYFSCRGFLAKTSLHASKESGFVPRIQEAGAATCATSGCLQDSSLLGPAAGRSAVTGDRTMASPYTSAVLCGAFRPVIG